MAAFLLPLIMGGVGALGGALGNRKQVNTQDTKSTTNSSNTSNPLYDEKGQIARDSIINMLMSRAENTPDFINSYANQGIQNINAGADQGRNRIEQLLASRGLGRTSAGLSPVVNAEMNRFNQISQFQNSLPQVADQYQRNNIDDFAKFFATLPVGTQNTGTSTTTGNTTGTTPSNMAAGALQGGASLASLFYGMMGGKKPGMGNT